MYATPNKPQADTLRGASNRARRQAGIVVEEGYAPGARDLWRVSAGRCACVDRLSIVATQMIALWSDIPRINVISHGRTPPRWCTMSRGPKDY
jgi:hypothetical protein